MRITYEMIRAASESVAKDDEGEFPPLYDIIGYSGENKTHTIIRAALEAALAVAPWREAAEKADAGAVALDNWRRSRRSK